MKRTTIFFFLVAFSFSSLAQIKPSNSEHFVKYKKQKSAAWVLLGGGAGLVGLGAVIGGGQEATFDEAGTGVIIAGVGIVSMLTSIPLFIASGRNKRKAMSMSFKNEMMPLLQNGSLGKSSSPSISIKIDL